ncbi:MAG: HAMP domain-containing sensor histidine kinase [Clostridium sp.]|uniref:sensor histidine kinase n=1 Tax=Clostridium sp. TaxID=1506 RepID=UPI00304E3F94
MNIKNKSYLKFNNYQNVLVILFSVFFLSLIYPCSIANGYDNYNYNEVLIITSQDGPMTWESKILEDLKSSLNIGSSNILLTTESLSIANTDKQFLDKQAELWSLKYFNTNFDLIIALDDESLNFIASYYNNQIFYNIPVLYGGINGVSKLSTYPYNHFVGVMEPVTVRTLIDSILKIEHEVSTINIILDKTISSKHIENQIRASAPYYSNDLNFNFIISNSIEDISFNLEKANNNSPCIISGNFKNQYETTLFPSDAIKSYTDGNLYTFSESYIGSGVIGGHVLLAKNHSKLIYEMATLILSGDSLPDISGVYDLENTFIFDASEMYNNNIPMKNIPETSIIINEHWINKQVSNIITIVLIFILITCIIMLIIQTTKKTNNARKFLITNRKYKEALESDKLKTESLANFSHEIRTLLNVMLSGLQLLDIYKNNGTLVFTNKCDESKLLYIRDNGFRLLKLINNIIDITKIDSGFYNLEFEIKNIVAVIEDITMSVVEYASDRGITIIFDTYVEDIYMPLDSEKLDRIMLNLISNSIKFTPTGGYIYVTLDCSKASVSVSVKDTGIGIPKEHQLNIFDRFSQVKSSSSKVNEGSGIGLALVKSLVDLLDGSISLSSELGEGCEFKFTLPIKEVCTKDHESETYISKNVISKDQNLIVEFSDIDSYLNM